MLQFNTAEISLLLQQKLSLTSVHTASLPAVSREAVFVQPAEQLQTFNFLFYETSLRFDQLHNMLLIFEPGEFSNKYWMQFQLGSRYYSNLLDVCVPFTKHELGLYSIKHLYLNAAKFEKWMSDIHGIEFLQRSTPVKRISEKVKSLLLLLPI
ncbi:hypothetical protein IQ13_0382 [Lacibacter cauensis]|uniref:Uncharacterized protein n=1 Tax=Lacibacter cauensis TaxID=510947 RepID=A0A562SVB4_9BACT|nr:hypothetical protein [Lacibacter cauensis]TWI85225.1 hypothetical protein IQ13_0382 [Lacibacter cauensis]